MTHEAVDQAVRGLRRDESILEAVAQRIDGMTFGRAKTVALRPARSSQWA